MLANFGGLQAHAFADDEQDTTPNAGVVDVPHAPVSGTFDAFGGFTVDHDGTRPHDFFDFSG